MFGLPSAMPFGPQFGPQFGPTMASPPFGLPNPFGSGKFDPTNPNALGVTRYHYKTPDGGVPMDGAVPSAPLGYGPPQPSCLGRFGMPMGGLPFGPPPCYSGLPPPSQSCPPGWFRVNPPGLSDPPVCAPPPGSIPRPPPVVQPATPPGKPDFRNTPQVAEPLSGNRVKNQLPVLKDGTSIIFPKAMTTIHLFRENLVNKFPPKPAHPNMVFAPSGTATDFTVNHIPCSMTMLELIEQTDCEKRANKHPPYNLPGRGYDPNYIGIQILEDLGSGWFALGSKICMTDPRARLTVGEVLGEEGSEAGKGKPKYLIRCPV